jgi:hypothetical protein
LDPVFALKIIVAPLLVGAMSVIARRFGPRVAGVLMGVPWMTGPVLFFLSLDKGVIWGAAAATGVLYGVTGIAGYILGFAWLARIAPWPVALLAGTMLFAAGSLGAREVMMLLGPGSGLELAGAAVLGFTSLLAAYRLSPRPGELSALRPLPWWDIPMRVLVTAGLVTIIMLSTEVLGTALSGIVSTFPVIATVVASFTHHRWGAEVVIVLLRGLAISLLSFVGFFTVIGVGLTQIGLVPSFALATLVSIAGSLIGMAMLSQQRRSG